MSSFRMEDNLCELAFERVITSIAVAQIEGLQVLRRGAVDELTEPCVTIFAATSEEESHQIGVTLVEMEFEWKSHYKDSPIDQHDALGGAVRDVLWRSDLVTLLNNAMKSEKFTATAWTRGRRVNTREGHSFVTKQSGTLLMYPWS